MYANQIFETDSKYIMPTYGRYQVALASGTGACVPDAEGKEYIDFSSGIGVCSIGYGNAAYAEAIADQAKKLAHISNLFYTEPGTLLARELCERSGMKRVFFANSGAESNEGAIKVARKYSFDKYGEGRSDIITLENSFHGRTVTTLAATGQDVFHNHFFPFTEGFRYASANDFDALLEKVDGKVCAIMMELVQGEGGVMPLDEEYVKKVAALCAEKDILLIFDEVQTGIGRCGTLYAFQLYGVQPDIVSSAKGLGGGLPIGAVLVGEKCEGVMGAGSHGSTFGANPICTRAALEVLKIVDDSLMAEVTKKGEYIREKISGMNLPQVSEIRGKGLMLGVIVPAGDHKIYAKKLIEAGLLVLTAGKNAIRFLPPLTITYDEIDRGLAIFEKIMKEDK